VAKFIFKLFDVKTYEMLRADRTDFDAYRTQPFDDDDDDDDENDSDNDYSLKKNG
jgi:hypothetical protein